MKRATPWGLAILFVLGCGAPAASPNASPVVATSARSSEPPMYRALPNLPPESIADDAYGKYLSAADAPGIGDVIPPFSLPVAAGGSYVLAERLDRDLVIVFYRGFW